MRQRGLEMTSDGVKALFSEIMQDSRNTEIDPNACIGFVKLRKVTHSGILRMAAIFTGKARIHLGAAAAGIALGADTPLVVELTGSLSHYVVEHFISEGESELEAKTRAASRPLWYGIVDGAYRHAAIVLLVEKHPRWKAFKWYVTVVKSGFAIERYRQLGRLQNMRHSPYLYIEFTYADVLTNLRMEHDRLLLEYGGKKVMAAQIARAFDGNGTYRTSSMLQTAYVAMRLPPSVISAISDVCNTEAPELCLGCDSLNAFGVKTLEELMEVADCRPFAKLFHSSSIKSSTVFLRSESEFGEKAQINTIYRCRDYSMKNGFKSVSSEIVTSMYQRSVDSLHEEKKFLAYIGSPSWPKELHTFRDNLLRSTAMDDEVDSIRGNENDILPSLLTAYARHYPLKAKEKESLHISKLQADASLSLAMSTASSAIGAPSVRQDILQEEVENGGTLEGNGLNVDHYVEELKKCGFECHCMRWQEYMKEVFKHGGVKFDCIVTDPPSAPSRSYLRIAKGTSSNVATSEEIDTVEMNEVAGACKNLVKGGGFVIVLLDFDMFGEWFTAFSKHGFDVMMYPYPFSFNPDTIPSGQTKGFPRNILKYSMLARAPGTHPDNFSPQYDSSFTDVEGHSSCQNAIISNVEWPKKKLTWPGTRKPFRTSEKSVRLLACIVDLFTPPRGSILDIYAGTFTTAMAAALKQRRCVSVEIQRECFNASVNRLFHFVRQVEARIVSEDRQESTSSIFAAVQRLCEGEKELEETFDVAYDIEDNSKAFECTIASPTKAGSDGARRLEEAERQKRRCEMDGLNNFEVSEEAKRIRVNSSISNRRVYAFRTTETATVPLSKNAKVQLLIDGRKVATAKLFSGADDQVYRRTLHGHSLETIQSPGEDLVVVTSFQPCINCDGIKFPYTCPGVEESPQTLADAANGGYYCWDRFSMSGIST